ncbi:MAG: TetR/AcrR family transcriptional regulator [Deltaproteobacteria bacterium]|nr:TetR/AcrR family transcriptional regulator [Deltaproteobacteria bacterium]
MTPSKEEKKQTLIEVSRKLLERYGPGKVTMEDVALNCGMGVSSLYYYFPDKAELLREVARTGIDETLQSIESSVSNARGAVKRLQAMSRTIFSMFRRISRFPGMTHSERLTELVNVDQEIERFKENLRRIIRQIFEQGVQEGVFDVQNPELAARVFTAGIRGMAETVLDGEFGEEEFDAIEQLNTLLLEGLKKR